MAKGMSKAYPSKGHSGYVTKMVFPFWHMLQKSNKLM